MIREIKVELKKCQDCFFGVWLKSGDNWHHKNPVVDVCKYARAIRKIMPAVLIVALAIMPAAVAAETVYIIEDRRILKTEAVSVPDYTYCYKDKNAFRWQRVPRANVFESEKEALEAYEWRLDRNILDACRRKRQEISLWDAATEDFKVLRPGRYGGYRNVAEAEVKELEQRFRDRKQTDLDIDVVFGALYQSCTRHTNSASIEEAMANLLMEARLDLQPR